MRNHATLLIPSFVPPLAALIVALVPATARAQLADGGMNLRLFRPAVDSKGLLGLDGTDILGSGDVSFGLVLDAGFGVLPLDGFRNDGGVSAEDAERTSVLVDRLFTGTLHLNVGIANRLVLGAQLPIQMVSGPNVTVPGQYNDGARGAGLDYQGVGDIVLHGKLRLLRVERDPVGLAAVVRVALPTGDERRFTGESGVALWSTVALEARPARRLRLVANVGYRAVFGDTSGLRVAGRTEPSSETGNATLAVFAPGSAGADLTWDDQLTFGAGLSVRVAEPLDVVGEVFGSQVVGAFGDEGALSVEALFGLKVFVEASSYLLLGGGFGVTDGAAAADARGMVGFVFEPSIGDRDGDGYRDDVDECPDEPEDFDQYVDADGCPDPDNDRDGILDVDDECPLVPEDRDGDADHNGCPEGGVEDRDGDGILDPADQCPDEPEDRDGFEDQEGCPDIDNDQDGILDPDDLCPDDPEDQDGFEDQEGCPDPDNDQDYILDVDDECPNDPERYNGTDDEDGCPDRGVLEMTDGGVIFFRKIQFQTDSARILDESFEIVDAVAAALSGHQEIEFVEIQGHADERASDAYNIELTRDRAAAVMGALVERGIAPERMRSAGYGERCPIDPRSNAVAWETNRRVEIRLLRTTEGPTHVEVACPAGRELIPAD